MARLRDPEDGCPWDLEQDFASIVPYTLEEAYEVDDAIRRRDWPGLCDELGDLLLQVVFHARMAEEAGHFAFDDVVAAIAEKLERRHPHVFGDAVVATADAQSRSWEAIKAAERAAAGKGEDPLAAVPLAMPALARAAKLQRRAERERPGTLEARVSDTADGAPASGERVGASHRIGERLFALVAEANRTGIDPEAALREANARFVARFRAAAGGS